MFTVVDLAGTSPKGLLSYVNSVKGFHWPFVVDMRAIRRGMTWKGLYHALHICDACNSSRRKPTSAYIDGVKAGVKALRKARRKSYLKVR